MRRAGLLSALLVTAALLCAMPGLLRSFTGSDGNRMDESLRPAKTRTLTVWLLGGGNDQRPLNELCAAFEKANRGVRVFLRRVDAAELEATDAVLPDAALFLTGQLVNPEQRFLPLTGAEDVGEDALASGKSGGILYAVPLWYMPNVLSLPEEWLDADQAPSATAAPKSFFGLGTPAPTDGLPQRPSLTPESLPWRKLYEENALWTDGSIALQQLLFLCPNTLRGELTVAYRPKEASAPAAGMARAWSLREHRAAEAAGERLAALPLRPAVSGEVRYLALCRDDEDARLFLRFLLAEDAQRAVQDFHYLPVARHAANRDALHGELLELFSGGLLFPNAFAHTSQELQALLADAYLRGADPVQTLLMLR